MNSFAKELLRLFPLAPNGVGRFSKYEILDTIY